MLDRLQDFQAASQANVSTSSHESPVIASPICDAQHMEISAILAKDAAARACYAEGSEALQDYRRVCLELRRAAMPSELRQRTLEMETVERKLQGLLARAQAAVAGLKEVAPESSAPAQAIRSSLSMRAVEQLQELAAGYFQSRRSHRDDMQRRARRQLRIAYPGAAADDVEDVLLYPELTTIALARRVERGAAGSATLQGVLDEFSGTRGDLLRLEEKARELKVQLMEFAEEIDQRGEVFDRVEKEIQETAEGMTETVRIFSSAAREKERRDAQMRSRWYCIGFVILGLLIFFFRKTLFWAGVQTSYYVASTGAGKAISGATGAMTSVSNISVPALRGARESMKDEMASSLSWNERNASDSFVNDHGIELAHQSEQNFNEFGNDTGHATGPFSAEGSDDESLPQTEGDEDASRKVGLDEEPFAAEPPNRTGRPSSRDGSSLSEATQERPRSARRRRLSGKAVPKPAASAATQPAQAVSQAPQNMTEAALEVAPEGLNISSPPMQSVTSTSFLQTVGTEVHKKRPPRRSREGTQLRLSLDAEGRAQLDGASPADGSYLAAA